MRHAIQQKGYHQANIYLYKKITIKMLFKQGYTYIMSNKYRTTFYIGVTNDITARVWQHINNEGSDFVKRYKLYDLVYYERHERITDVIDREKQLENWHRDWKINLIKSVNPDMKDLKGEIGLEPE